MRPSPLAALAALTLVLTGCGADRSDEAGGQSPSPSTQPSWSNWIDIDSPKAIFDATDEYAVIGETGEAELAVYDRTGQELWTLPEPRDFLPDLPAASIASNADSVFVMGAEALTAFDWATGEQQWSVDLSAIGECVLPEDVSLLTSRLTEAVGIGDTLVLNASADDDAYGKLPQSCFGETTSDIKEAEVLLGIDAETGETRWSRSDSLNHKQLDAALSLDGRFADRIVTNRLPIFLERTDIETGEHVRARLMLDEWGYDFPDPVYMDDLGHDEFAIDLNGKGFVLSTIESWSENPEAAKSHPPGDGEPCEVDVSSSRTGIQYCLRPPNDEGDYLAKLVRGQDASGAPAAETTPLTAAPWTAPGPAGIEHDPETKGPGTYGIDPIAPRDGSAPIIALPGPDSALTGFDLTTGDVAWTVPGERAEYTSFVPEAGEFVTLIDGQVVGIDAVSGEEAWSEAVPFDDTVQMSAKGAFVLVRGEGAGRSALRTIGRAG